MYKPFFQPLLLLRSFIIVLTFLWVGGCASFGHWQRSQAVKAEGRLDAGESSIARWETVRDARESAAKHVLDRHETRLQQAGIRVERDAKGRLLVRLSGRALNFKFGKARLKGQVRKTLKTIARILKPYPETRILIEGHTDSVGSVRSNLALSQDRADRVKRQLLKYDVLPQSIVSAVGYGEAYPIADNATAAGRTRNRRVELSITIDAVEAEANLKKHFDYQ